MNMEQKQPNISRSGNGNGRAKLELLLNQPARVKLLKDKPFEGSSSYGEYRLYSVEHEGAEKAYFATEEVHEEIQAHKLKAGDEVILTKIAQQNGRRVVPRIKVEPLPRVQESEREGTKQGPEKSPGVDNLKDVMEVSLREAVEITRAVSGVPFQNEDIQKIASCLFIARTRGGNGGFNHLG